MKKSTREINQPINQTKASRIGRRLFLAGLVVTATSATGCKHLVERSQSPDAQILQLQNEQKNSVNYVNNICSVWGLDYAKIEGIGLAVGLNATGSNPMPCNQRDYLATELESKSEIDDIEKLLASSDTELVLIKGLLPPGIRKGEPFDLEVRPMNNSEATSLENGRILQTRMRPMEMLGRSVKKGHVKALAKGGILVDSLFESRKDQPNQLHGYILGGGVTMEDRKLGLAIQGPDVETKTSTLIARAINARYTWVDNAGRHGVAEPKTDRIIEVVVPDVYRHNVGRFLQIIGNMVYGETTGKRLARLEQLERDLLDPNLSRLASIRIEAYGQDGVPVLTRALSSDDFEVKFQSAQALAYLGETSGVPTLKTAAETEPAFRWHAMTALASLDEVDSGNALKELMHVKSAETRYGAFRAMRARSPQDPTVQGNWNSDFFLHRLPSKTDPMIHFSRAKRPEIVVFGDDQTVSQDFLFVQSGATFRATEKGMISVVRYTPSGKQERTLCSNRVGDMIETLSKEGLSYGDLLKLFRESKNAGTLNSRLVVNAVPKLGRTYVPGQSAEEPPAEQSDRYVAEELPGLFHDGNESSDPPEEKLQPVSTAPAEKKTAKWGTMTDWLK